MNIANIVRALLSLRSYKKFLKEVLYVDGKNEGVLLNRRVVYISPVPILISLFILFFLFDAISKDSIGDIVGYSILIFLLILSFIVCIIYFYNCRIYYSDQNFIVSNFFGKKRTYHYEDIEKIIQGSLVWEIHLKNETVRLRTVMEGGQSFLRHAKSKKDFTVLPKQKKDIFDNNVKDPSSYVALFWIVISLFIVGIFCCAIFGFPKDYSSLPEESIFFEKYETTKSLSNDLILYSSNASSPYRIFGYNKKIEDLDTFLKDIGQHTEFKIRAEFIEKNDYYTIITISSKEEFISIDSAHQFELHRYVTILVILGLILFILLTISGIMVHIGRNPNRYSNRVVRLFFKEGTLKTQGDGVPV